MLFEGIGASVQNNLFKQLSPNYERTVFVLASNYLPAPESQGVTATMFNKDIWHPLCTRVNFSHLTEPHKNDEEFPYTGSQLAHALDLLTRYPQLCRNTKDVDECKPPSNPKDFPAWHEQQTRTQAELFSTELETLASTHPEEDANPDFLEQEGNSSSSSKCDSLLMH